MRILLLIVVACASTMIASAQLGSLVSPFAPTDCLSSAKTAVGGTSNNPRLIAILNANATIPVQSDNVVTGMDASSGKARIWYYLFIASAQDTLAGVPMIKLVGACQDPSALFGNVNVNIPIEELPKIPLPSMFVEGASLATSLGGNSEYQRYRTANPDSQPSLTILTSSDVEVLGFPAATPFWFVNWSIVAGSGSQQPFSCLVHAVTGQTLCGDQIIATVAEVNDPSVYLAPNPVRDNALLNLPLSWMGRQVTIEAVSTSGTVIELLSINQLPTPVTTINSSMLSTGAYTLRARTATEVVVLPMSVIR